MFKESLTPKDGAEIMGSYSHGIKVDIGNNKEMIFVMHKIRMEM